MNKSGKGFYKKEYCSEILKYEEGYCFEYVKDYLNKKHNQPISATIPLQDKPFHIITLFSFFDVFIFEVCLLDKAEKYWKSTIEIVWNYYWYAAKTLSTL